MPHVIFSPGRLALDLANGLTDLAADVTLFSPGPVDVKFKNITADLSLFKAELKGRSDTYLDLLQKHPFTFVTLARQIQAEIIAQAFYMANQNELDIVHIYTNEEDTALPFAKLCKKPVVLTHHDPFNFLVKYKSVFPKYKDLNWVSLSYSQRLGMPDSTNWVGNIYNGVAKTKFKPVASPSNDYFAYLGRIIENKGLHLVIAAAKQAGVKLKIAGKHYSGKKDHYWQTKIKPELDGNIEYVGFIKDDKLINEFLGNAKALIIPSTYDEPFGMVSIEALACGTPVIGLDCGATKEIIDHNQTGLIVKKADNDDGTVAGLTKAIKRIDSIKRIKCRQAFEKRFTLKQMCEDYLAVYKRLTE